MPKNSIQQWKPFDFPLNGRLITKLDPSLIPEGHFQTLQNMRYNDGGIEGISGMTKINSSAFNYTKTIGGFHFRKQIPNTESHVLTQTQSATTGNRIVKSDNSTSIPAQDTFTSFVTLPTNNYVNFAESPDQSMVMCDGYTNYVYSGNEYRCAKFINFDSAGTFSYDYTEILNNNLTDTNNVAILYGATNTVDANSKILLQAGGANGSTTMTDSSGTSKSVTAVGNAQIDTSNAPPLAGATGSINFDGTGDYLTVPDSTDWYLAAGDFTINFWEYLPYSAQDAGICGQYADANNYWYIEHNWASALYGNIIFKVVSGGVTKAEYTWDTGTPTSTWDYFRLVRSGTNVYFFSNGKSRAATVGTAISTNEIPNLASVLEIGACANHALTSKGRISCFEIIKGTALSTTDFTVPSALATSGSGVSVYIGSSRPISGIKFYISTANASAAIASGYYWGGSSYVSLTTFTDGTSSGGKTLSQTGIISFDSTVGLCKVKAINENVAYWYKFVFLGIDAATALSQVSLVCPVQGLVDIWDGQPRQIYSFVDNGLNDRTSQVYKIDYYKGDDTTYFDIGGYTPSKEFYIGFNERLLGFKVYFGGNDNINSNAAVMSIDYWNGSAWTDVGAIDDATSNLGKSFNHSGVVTWNPPPAKSEYVVGTSAKWYYYRIHFSATLSSDVYIDNITGIPVQADIPAYRFPVLWQNRLWLLNDQSRNKNTAIGSSYGTVFVFNGQDSAKLTFGGTEEVVCAAPLFTRYGGSIYENLIVCKRNKTYLVDGTSPNTYIVYQIAKSVGCIAPSTMKVCDTGYEVAPGLTKHVVVWLSDAGVVMFDANSVINISSDIADRFDPTSSNYINTAITNKFTAFYDAKRTAYHIQIATGSSTTLNEEWVYDLARRKWYQINRGAKYLTCGFEVEDAVGNNYVYGGTDDGYLERLEYGNTFDGVAITYKFRLPDGLLDKSLNYRKEVRRLKLTGKVNTTSATITVRHYADGSTSASTPAIKVISQNVTGKRIYQVGRSVSFMAVFHSWEFEVSTSDIASGFNPLYVSGLFRVIDEDLYDGYL